MSYFLFWLHHAACGILVPWPGVEPAPAPTAVEVWSLNHWISREVPEFFSWCFWTVVLVKTLESSLDCKEIQPVHPKVDQSWVFIGGTDVEVETPILWAPDAKSWLIWKDPDAGKDWVQEEKWMTEDEMVGWHHGLKRHGFGWTLGVCDGQGGLACCGSWGRKELDTTERLNWLKMFFLLIKLQINTQIKVNLCLPFWLTLKIIILEDLCACFQYLLR